MPLLEVKNLVKRFPIKGGLFGRVQGYVHAVSGVSLAIEEGQTLGLVGESGSGKTTLGRTILQLLKPDDGEVIFDGQNLSKLSASRLRKLRRQFQIIFQDPYSSLNPRMTIEDVLSEGMVIYRTGGKGARRKRVLELLEIVGLPSDAAGKYPHEFSGGQRQRIGIARALSLLPKLMICDEPVSALDVSIQAQIINLLIDLKKEFGLTYLFISHDLKVVHQISDRIVVMYLGKIMEDLPAEALFISRHPYTQALLAAIPRPDPRVKGPRKVLQGEIPSPIHPPSGCVFHTRCPFAQEICKREVPVLRELASGHQAACHLAEEIPKFEMP
ncbi:MAG: oligopeptide/dipeptide ABC transporter ATP-binding protein [bacterium]